MRPEQNSQYWLSSTQLEAKMLEYGIPKGLDSPRRVDPAHLFPLSIGLLGDFASAINREEPYLDHHSKLRSNLLFSARFFDSYLQSKLNETPDPYFVILVVRRCWRSGSMVIVLIWAEMAWKVCYSGYCRVTLELILMALRGYSAESSTRFQKGFSGFSRLERAKAISSSWPRS